MREVFDGGAVELYQLARTLELTPKQVEMIDTKLSKTKRAMAAALVESASAEAIDKHRSQTQTQPEEVAQLATPEEATQLVTPKEAAQPEAADESLDNQLAEVSDAPARTAATPADAGLRVASWEGQADETTAAMEETKEDIRRKLDEREKRDGNLRAFGMVGKSIDGMMCGLCGGRVGKKPKTQS